MNTNLKCQPSTKTAHSKIRNGWSAVLRHRLRRGRNSKRRPFLGLHPCFAAPPSRFCQSELECRRAHSLSVAVGCAVADAWGALGLSIGKARSLVVAEAIQLRAVSASPAQQNTVTSSYYSRHSDKHPRGKPDSLGHRFSGTAFGWFSFLTFVSRRSLELRSAPPVNPACAALRGTYTKIAPCSLPRP